MDTLLRDSLRTDFETAFDGGQYAEAIRRARVLQSWHLQQRPLDSLSLLQAYKNEGMAWGTLNRYDSMYLANTAAMRYAPDSPGGRRLEGALKISQIGLANALRIPISLQRELAEIERLYADIPEATKIERERLYATVGFKHTQAGYYELAEKYLLRGKAMYNTNRTVYEQIGTGPLRLDLQYAQLLHRLYSEQRQPDKMLTQLAVFDSLHTEWTFSPYEASIYARTLMTTADFYLTDPKHPTPTVALPYLNKARRVLDPNLHANYLRQVTHYEGVAARLSGELARAQEINAQVLAAVTTQDQKDVKSYRLERLRLANPADRTLAAYELVQTIHRGEDSLRTDYANFLAGADVGDAGVLTEAAALLESDVTTHALAAQLYRLALAQFEDSYQGVSFSNKLRGYYEPALAGLLRLAEKGIEPSGFGMAALLETMARVESRLAWSEFRAASLTDGLRLPDSLQLQEQQLRAALTRAKLRPGADSLVFSLEEQLQKLLDEIAYTYPQHAELANPDFKLVDLQEALAEGELILRYKFLDDELYRFSVDNANVRVDKMETGDWAAAVSAQLGALRELANAGADALLPSLLVDVDPAVRRIIVIPDGPLLGLPFELLGVNESAQPAVENYAISYQPYLIFAQPKLEKQQGEQLYVFAPRYPNLPKAQLINKALRDGETQLDGAAAESRYVAELFRGRIFDATDAAKAEFMRHAPQADLLHLAMHAHIDAEQPELSYFNFGPKTERLYVEELYGMRLRANLAVLSACNTGRGVMDENSGLVSLHRAFTYAGVSATVASLWAVPDAATEQLMRYFYDGLAAGLDKATALQRAKLSYRANTSIPELRTPFYWAGFVLYGDDIPVHSGGWAWWIYVLLAGGVIGAGSWLARKMG